MVGVRPVARLGAALVISGWLILVYASSIGAIGQQYCGDVNGYHYAGQLTSTSNAFTQCATPSDYEGWNGVDGQLQTPATLAQLGNYTTDHELGLFSAQLDNGSFWLQLGWYTGQIGTVVNGNCDYAVCTERFITYGYYIEDMTPQGYTVFDKGYAPNGSARTSDMIYNKNTGCWEAYLSYGGLASETDCTESYHTGAMWATTEVEISSGVVATMPTAVFGTSNPNTNAALRLHGANGWVSWNGSLSSYYTATFDEHSYTPAYTLARLSNCCWDFEDYLG